MSERLTPASHARQSRPERDVPRARALALDHGWNAMAYQVVNDGIRHWFSGAGDAVVGFVRAHGVSIAAGAPICAGTRLPDVLREWHAFVSAQGDRACYFGAAGRLFDALHGAAGYSTVVLGAQPVWDPHDWLPILETSASLRGQINRACNKGVRVSEWASDRASADPRLRQCLNEWLATRVLPPLHFLIEPHTLHDLQGRRVFVAERGDDVVGFINASPVPARAGWLVEQFVRGSHAPHGTVEAMLDVMMRTVAADGAQYVTMGLVPLRDGADPHTAAGHPAWLSPLLAFIRLHGRRFYNFGGLDRFKTKLRPSSWEPIYAISAEPQFSARTLYAIATAFTVQSPMLAIAKGAVRAAREEVRTLTRRACGLGGH